MGKLCMHVPNLPMKHLCSWSLMITIAEHLYRQYLVKCCLKILCAIVAFLYNRYCIIPVYWLSLLQHVAVQFNISSGTEQVQDPKMYFTVEKWCGMKC